MRKALKIPELDPARYIVRNVLLPSLRLVRLNEYLSDRKTFTISADGKLCTETVTERVTNSLGL